MFKFTARKGENISKFIDKKEEFDKISNLNGNINNIIFPKEIKKNIDNFKSILEKYKIKNKIFYVHKCNKSSAIAREMKFNEMNIDVASVNELRDALSTGFTGKEIEATGPKNDEFIILGLQHDIIFNIDSIEEIYTILKYQRIMSKKTKTKILVRLNDFRLKNIVIANKKSRFGENIDNIKEIARVFQENMDDIELYGISFHLDTVNLKEKVIAIENSLSIIHHLDKIGLNPQVLNIGGGFKINYIESKQEWEESIRNLRDSIMSGENNYTWNNNHFGLRIEDGKVKGMLSIYNFYEDVVMGKYLEEILTSELSPKFNGQKVYEAINDLGITLFIEPGKSLLNNVGINFTKVIAVKENGDDKIVVLDMKKTDYSFFDMEMFLDPVLISKNEEEKTKEGVFLVGNLCLEIDMIFKHKVFFDRIPKKDDYIVFINTAGYFMDFNQSNTIMQDTAKKIICVISDGKMNYYSDETYNPYKLGGKNVI